MEMKEHLTHTNGDLSKPTNRIIKLMVKVKEETTFRIKKIEIKLNYAIDHIKITYDDDTVWTCGHDNGKKSNMAMIMTKGEYLVRVAHEQFLNLKCAAASIEFETNKGRIFKYCPGYLVKVSTKKGHEMTTIEATPGHEIYGLTIRRGTLIGSHQQPVPESELVKHPKHWYSILSHKTKEENTKESVHYYEKSKALNEFKKLLKASEGQKGQGLILVDCISRSILKSTGDGESTRACTKRATEEGLYSIKEEEDVSIRNVIVKLFQILANKKETATMILVTLFMFLSSCFNLEGNLLTGDVLTLVAGNETGFKSNWYANKTCAYLTSCDGSRRSYGKAIIIAYLLIKGVENLLSMLEIYFRQYTCEKKNSELQRKGFEQILSLDQPYFDTHTMSEIRGNLNVHSVNRLVSDDVPRIVSLAISIVVTAYYLISINCFLGLFAVVGTVLMQLLVVSPIGRLSQKASKAQRKTRITMSQITDSVLNMITTVKMFSQEEHHMQEIQQSEARCVDSLYIQVILRCLESFGSRMTTVIMFASSLFVSLEFVSSLNLTTSELIGFFFLLRNFEGTYCHLQWRITLVAHELPDIDRFVTLMEAKPSLTSGDVSLKDIEGSVEFDNVHFSYPSRPGELVLTGFNMKIQLNKTTAIVGDSGAGKSTITKLLMRLYDPTEGTIKIDGHDLRTLSLREVHQQVGIVSQNPELFNLPLCENIAYGTKHEYSEDKVEIATKLANCDFVSKFRGGLDTFVGSGGSQLSGGQKQRVAIARAVIRNPKILILDEATSSLDAENEKLVQDALEKIMKNRTVIVIAHRLSTIKYADEIICMKDGEAVERGTHDELMRNKNAYYNLVSRQTEDKEKLI